MKEQDRLRAQILVVDDHAPSCELNSEILRSAGFEANSLTSSAKAAEQLTRDKFHAVFMDMRMPPPDGLELARKVRASRLNASTVIVMIMGEQDRTLMKRAFEIGVQFFLFKPVERNNLLKLIRVAESSIKRERRRFTRVPLRCAVSLESNDMQLEGTTVEIDFTLRPGETERKRQSRDPRGGTQARGVFGCDRSPPKRFPGTREEKPSGSLKLLPGKTIEMLRPAACQVLLAADWAKERKLRMLPSDCFKTGRRSLTQSSVEAIRG